MIVAPDEMTKWVMSMDQYKGGKGGDRPFYLSAWCVEPILIDRAKHMKEPIAVPHPFLTVVGGLTPDMLSSLPEGRGRDDGFLARLLLVYPDRVPRGYSEEGVPEAVAQGWSNLVRTLWRLPMRILEGKPVPWVVTMTPEAQTEWAGWCRTHRAEQDSDTFPRSLEGCWGKLESYAARHALILHLMELATDPSRCCDALPELPRQVVANAARLIAYLKTHLLRVRASIGGKSDHGSDDVQALIRWIDRNDRAEFSTRDIDRNFDRFRDNPAALVDALQWMSDRNIIRQRQEPDKKTGRKRSPSFEVNPALKTTRRFRHFRQNDCS
jgi:hypothetical protein